MSSNGRHFCGLRALRHTLTLSTLTACAIPQPAATTATPAQPPPNPILQAVAAGSNTTIATTTGPITITITASYISAAGQQCRAYTLSTPSASTQQNLACNTGATWQQIPPLAANANPGSPQ